MTPNHKREVVKFTPNMPVEVALKFALPGKVVSTQTGERVMFTLADDRVMFLDLDVARKIDDLGVNVRERFFVCRPSDGKKNAEWNVWLSPETEKARSEMNPPPDSPKDETPLERQLRESIELVKQGKLGDLGNGSFAVPNGASARTPAPVQSGASNGHQATNNGHDNTDDKSENSEPKHPESSGPPVRAQALLEQANSLVDVYAAALSSASTKHGNQVKPEDVRSLLVTVFIQRSKVGTYGA